MKYLGQVSNDNDIVNNKKLDTELAGKLENSNLLANGDFELNSKGQTVYGDPNNTTTQYPAVIETMDKWYFNRDYNGTFNADTKLLSVGSIGTFSILFSSTDLQANKYEGKTFTLSVNAVGDNSASLFYGIGYGDKTNEVNYTNIAQGGNKGTGTFVISATIPTNLADTKVIKVRLYKNAGSATINWVKLEFGSINTPNIPSNYEKLINKVSSVDANSTNDQYASAKCVYDNLQTKQNTLVSGTNIKTINNESILGSGNITISGSSAVTSVNTKTGAVVLNADDISDSSTTNKFVTSSEKSTWNGKQNAIDSSHKLSADVVDDSSSTNKFVTASDKTTWNGKQAGNSKLTSISGLSNSSTGLIKLTNGTASLDTTNYIKASNFLGQTVEGTNADTPLNFKGNSTSTYIGFKNNSNEYLGWFGVNSDKKPVFDDTNGDRELAYKSDIPAISITKSANGCATIPGGLKVAWGTVTAGQPFSVTFAGSLSFSSSTSYQVVLTPLFNSNSGSGGFWVKTKSTTGFTGSATAGFGTIQYFAVGY